jgi:DMSO/TMAO reductase YedYZ molybdopterin-dependent catalytic subunit
MPLGRAAFLGTIAAGVLGVAAITKVGGMGVGNIVGSLGNVLPTGGIVPTGGWRIYNVQDPMPTFDPATYALTIDGEVENPVRLTWSDVEQTPMIESVSDFHCVTGWSVENVHWKGIAPATVLDLVRPKATARHVNFQSLEEPYFDQLTMKQFQLKDVLLATEMDGLPLKRVHGAPMRLVIPQMYGYKGVKWLSHITFERDATPGYWETRGYDADAWVGRDVYT